MSHDDRKRAIGKVVSVAADRFVVEMHAGTDNFTVVGFDDVPQAASPHYQLTTYRQPLAEMAGYLVDVLESADSRNLDRKFTGELVIRHSA